MPGVARDQDTFETGHICDETSTITGPSTNVFCNSRGVERVGDPTVEHKKPTTPSNDSCHPSSVHVAEILKGSSDVYVNGISMARKGDAVDKFIVDGAITSASTDTYANG